MMEYKIGTVGLDGKVITQIEDPMGNITRHVADVEAG